MANNPKQTGKQAASAASKVLRSSSTGKTSKTAAGSALAQTPYKKKQVTQLVPKQPKYLSIIAPMDLFGALSLFKGYFEKVNILLRFQFFYPSMPAVINRYFYEWNINFSLEICREGLLGV